MGKETLIKHKFKDKKSLFKVEFDFQNVNDIHLLYMQLLSK